MLHCVTAFCIRFSIHTSVVQSLILSVTCNMCREIKRAVLLGATESVTKLRRLRNSRDIIIYYCECNCVSVSVNTYRYCEMKLVHLLFDFGVVSAANNNC